MHQQKIEDIEKLYSEGLGIRLISQKVGVSKQTVRMRLIRAGVYRGQPLVDCTQKQKDKDTIPVSIVPPKKLEIG